jgi:hypothetical protein
MRNALTSLLAMAFALALVTSNAPAGAVADAATSAPSGQITPPPQIYEIVTRPICHELKEHILPAVALVLQNDRVIAKSPPIFEDYITTALRPDPTNKSGYDTTDYDSPGRAMAIRRMENLVTPLAQNVIALQKILENTSINQPNPSSNPADAAALAKIREQLEQTRELQSASLDLINGFVTTQQLGDIQHVGEEYLSNINATGLTTGQNLGVTPNPFQDPDQPGLPANPHNIEPATLPGLAVGYNPVKVVSKTLDWVRGQTAQTENDVAKSMTQIANSCNTGAPLPEPAPPSSPQ